MQDAILCKSAKDLLHGPMHDDTADRDRYGILDVFEDIRILATREVCLRQYSSQKTDSHNGVRDAFYAGSDGPVRGKRVWKPPMFVRYSCHEHSSHVLGPSAQCRALATGSSSRAGSLMDHNSATAGWAM
jgi:hypothetical protein